MANGKLKAVLAGQAVTVFEIGSAFAMLAFVVLAVAAVWLCTLPLSGL